MLRSSKAKWITAVVSLVALVLLILLMGWLRPGVPKQVTILAGPETSRSTVWAERYAKYVEARGVRANVVSTAGSGEILDRFSKTEAPTVGFLQSGIERDLGDGKASGRLQSLGSLYFEPIWLLVREGSGIRDIPDLREKRIYIGPPGSDARAAVWTLFDTYGLDRSATPAEMDGLTPGEAADALLAGDLDGAFFAGESAGGLLNRLLSEEALVPISARHAEVFTKTHPDLGNLLIPQGLFSLRDMIPREDVRVIAPAINLVSDQDLHPALVDLFLEAATELHRGATLISKRGEFPSEDYTSLPMNPNALRYYKQGPSGLRKYLPFWVASLIDQLIIYGLPVFVVLSTVFKGIPVYLEWKTKIDLLKFYRRLAAIERAPDLRERPDAYLGELDVIDAESAKLHVPGLHLPLYFELRQYLHDMRERMELGE